MTSQWPATIRHRLHFAILILAVIGLLERDLAIALSFKSRMSSFQISQIPANYSALPFDVLNNQTYIWYGNQWISPPGVPVYTREDMISAFSQFDTLWIGDSTARRAYATMFALMNSSTSSVRVVDLNHPKVIDVNKYAHKGKVDENSCERQRENVQQYFKPGMLNIWTKESLCRQVAGRSFDYVRADCLKEIYHVSRLQWELQRYSLIIIGVGIHDLIRPHVCSIPLKNKGVQKGKSNVAKQVPVEEVLNSFGLQSAQQIADIMKQSPKHIMSPTAVLWRTTGFSSATTDNQRISDTIRGLNERSVQFIQNKSRIESSNGTLALVDWGTAIWPRSLPPDRIEGDLDVHYGLEARLLMAQMTTQQLIKILEHSRSTAK